MRLSTFCVNDNVLLVGEGNFSFAVSLVKHNLSIAITATCYESSIVHDITKNNVDFLRMHGNRVLFGVDATKLAEHKFLKAESFDKIIFNFPHVGGKMRLDKNRELLRQFFVEAQHFLKPNGSILMTLCNGQGGTLVDEPKRRWDDSWKVTEMAAHGNLILTHVETFAVSNFQDYTSSGYRGLEKEFNMQNSLTHFFKKVSYPIDFAPKIKLNFPELKIIEEKISFVDILPDNEKNLHPPNFVFDITFSVPEDFRESNLYAILYNFAGKIVRNIEFVRCYKFPDEKLTKTYRISYQSDEVPLYRERIVDVHRHFVAKILENNLNVIVTR